MSTSGTRLLQAASNQGAPVNKGDIRKISPKHRRETNDVQQQAPDVGFTAFRVSITRLLLHNDDQESEMDICNSCRIDGGKSSSGQIGSPREVHTNPCDIKSFERTRVRSQSDCDVNNMNGHAPTNRRYSEGSQCNGLPGGATFQELVDWLERLHGLTASEGSTACMSVGSDTEGHTGP
jgi:hypothetical protein